MIFVFNPVVTLTKRLEVTCIGLDQLVPVHKTFVLGHHQTPWNNFLSRIVMTVAKDLVLQEACPDDIDTYFLLVRVDMEECEQSTKLHLVVQFKRHKVSWGLLAVELVYTGCRKVHKIFIEVDDSSTA